MKFSPAYIGIETRNGEKILVDLVSERVEQYSPDTRDWEEVKRVSYGDENELVFDWMDELIMNEEKVL